MFDFFDKHAVRNHLCRFMFLFVRRSFQPGQTVAVQLGDTGVFPAGQEIPLDVLYDSLYFAFALRIMPTAKMNRKARIPAVRPKRLCQNQVSGVLAYRHDPILIIHNLRCPPAEISERQVMGAYKFLRVKRVLLEIHIFLPAITKYHRKYVHLYRFSVKVPHHSLAHVHFA